MNRQNGSRIAVLALAALIPLAGCTDDKKPAQTGATPPPSPAIATTQPPLGKAPTYKMPEKLCDAAPVTAFTDVLGNSPKRVPGRQNTGQNATTAACAISGGTLDNTIVVSIAAEIYKDASKARATHEGMRGIQDNPITDVPGLADAAYRFTDSLLGEVLVLRHGNANLQVSVSALGTAKKPPTDAQQRLITFARDLLTALPAQ